MSGIFFEGIFNSRYMMWTWWSMNTKALLSSYFASKAIRLVLKTGPLSPHALSDFWPRKLPPYRNRSLKGSPP